MTQAKFINSRRDFLQRGLALSAFGTGAPLVANLAAMGTAAAQTAGDYKALVCVFLQGGNDAYNTVLATDDDSWDAYSTVRSSIALPKSSLLALNPARALPSQRSLALHPQLGGLQNLFNVQRRLAVVSNVGPLIEPMSKIEYLKQTKRRPAKLFSHNDQQSTWQALGPEGAALGWGGRLADGFVGGAAGPIDKTLFSGISTSGNAVWLSGQKVRQYQMQPSGVIKLGLDANNQVFNSTDVAAALQRVVSQTTSNSVFSNDLAAVSKNSITVERAVNSKLPSPDSAPFGPTSTLYYNKPGGGTALNPLAQQFQVVARTMAARTSLSMTRQVFFVSLGGFDTHDNQLSRHADLMARLNHALMYFDNVVNQMGLTNNVTTFTASDFGRSFTSNGDGTDHGWGGHHFVMGGAVQGGTVIGDIPTYSRKNSFNNEFDGSPDQLVNGALLPKVSIEQYGSALGSWFGAGSSLSSIFPNLGNFSGVNLMRG